MENILKEHGNGLKISIDQFDIADNWDLTVEILLIGINMFQF